MLLSMRPISGCRRDAHVDAVVAHLNVDRPQAIFGVTAVAARFDVEFPAVPGTDDVALLGETQAAAGLVRRKLLLDARDHLALTDRTAVVRAMILIRHQAVTSAKSLISPTMISFIASPTSFPRRHSRSPRRYHICRSKKLRSAARMIAQIAVTASVAFTGCSPNGASSRARSSDLAA